MNCTSRSELFLSSFVSSVRRWTFDVGRSTFGLLVITLLSATAACTAEPAADEPIFRDNDRVVLLGGAFVERMQTYNYVETALTALVPQRNAAFRNLGWSGDEATGVARAVFGKPDDGFQRLQSDVAVADPTVILVAYGANEAYRGPEQLATFQAQLDRLLDQLGKLQPKPRLVIVTPPRHENLGPPLPDPAEYNQSLAVYRGALLETAEKRKLPVLDLYSLISSDDAANSHDVDRLTDNGLHLSGYGYWRAALHIAGELGDKPPAWTVDLDAAGKPGDVVGTQLSGVTATARGVRFTALDEQLPFPAPPLYSPAGAERLVPPRNLRVRGLAAGTYDLLIDGRRATSAARSARRTSCSSTATGRRTKPTCSCSASTSKATTPSRSRNSTRSSQTRTSSSPNSANQFRTSTN